MADQFIRTRLLVGDEPLERLKTPRSPSLAWEA